MVVSILSKRPFFAPLTYKLRCDACYYNIYISLDGLLWDLKKNSLGYWHMFLKSFDIATSSCVTKPWHETFIISFYSTLALIFCVRHKIFRAVLIWPHCYIFLDTFVKCKDQYLPAVLQFHVAHYILSIFSNYTT